VLEKWGWGGGVLEYCAKSESHPATAGLEVLKGRYKGVLNMAPVRSLPSYALSALTLFFIAYLGLADSA
jgi:hypothetical protein